VVRGFLDERQVDDGLVVANARRGDRDEAGTRIVGQRRWGLRLLAPCEVHERAGEPGDDDEITE